MKLFQAVKTCGEIAALNFDESYFDSDVAPADKDVGLLVVAARFVTDELFTNYGYCVASGVFDVAEGICQIDNLVKALSVTDERGNVVAFSYTRGGLYVTDVDKVRVVYYVRPKHAEWTDEVPVPACISCDRAVIYGMLANYFLMRGDAEQSEVWASRFADVCQISADKKHCGNLPTRRWL